MARRRKPWKRPKDLPKGEIWPPDKGQHPIPESWKEEQRRGHTTPTTELPELVEESAIKRPDQARPVTESPSR